MDQIEESVVNQFEYYISIDDYINDVNEFNVALKALKKNKIDYNVFISIKAPFKWYINMDSLPIMMFYDIGSKPQQRWLVSVIKPMDNHEANLLKRRNFNNSILTLDKFVMNDAFKSTVNSDAVVFRYETFDELRDISNKIKNDIKIYALGTYKRNYKLALCPSKFILSYIEFDRIIAEKSAKKMNKPGEFEAYINWNGLLNKTKILKTFKSVYFMNGKRFEPSYAGKIN